MTTPENTIPADKPPQSLAEQLAFKSRFVLVFGEIDDTMARRTCERLIALAQESDKPIQLLISSPGGGPSRLSASAGRPMLKGLDWKWPAWNSMRRA